MLGECGRFVIGMWSVAWPVTWLVCNRQYGRYVCGRYVVGNMFGVRILTVPQREGELWPLCCSRECKVIKRNAYLRAINAALMIVLMPLVLLLVFTTHVMTGHSLVRFGDPESVTEKFINPILAPSCFGSHTSVPGELKSKLITQGAHNSRFSPSRRCWWPSWERSRWTVGTWASRVGWATRHSSRGFSRERSEKTSCSARILTKLATGKSSRSAPCNRCVGLHCLRVSWQQAHRRVEQLPQQCSRVTVISVGGCIWGCRVILYHYDHKDD